MEPDQSPFLSAETLAADDDAALKYLSTRVADMVNFIETPFTKLSYVATRVDNRSGRVLVGTQWCENKACAIAYILARWW